MGVEIERKWLHDTVSGSVCKFAFKTCGTLSRIEIEKYIMFEVGGVEVACIEVNGQYTIVEVEFDNVEAANAYTPPFEGTEVTDNPDYYKRNYWKKTRLEK